MLAKPPVPENDLLTVKTVAKSDPVHCAIFSLVIMGFTIAMVGLAAVPVGDVQFSLVSSTQTFNATFPTRSSYFPDEKKALIGYVNGVATFEFGYNKTLETFSSPQTLGTALLEFHSGDSTFTPYQNGQYRPYTPGLKVKLVGNFYLPTYEWKVIPEEMPLLWISPIWCFLTGLLVMYGSVRGRTDLLLNALIFVGVSSSLVLISSHRVVELTYMCRTCNGMTSDKGALSDGSLGKLLDGVSDPDDFADNNCPSTLQMKCEKGTAVYLAGSIILLICMYVLLVTIEVRRYFLKQRGNGLASQDGAKQ